MDLDVPDDKGVQWLSPHTGATYPSGWLVELPEQQLALTVTP